MVHSRRARWFVLSLVSAALVYLSMAATVTDAAEGPLVPVRYIITKSDKYSGDDTDPDLSCMPQDNLTVSCPGRDGRLFDMVDSSRNRIMKWKISHHWRSSEGREKVHVELVFSCPVNITAMTWHFFQDSDAYVPSSSNWSFTVIAQTGTNSTSRYIKGMPMSQGETFKLSMSNISGFPASSHWSIIIPLPSPRNWLFLNELDILGFLMNRIVPQSYSIAKSDQFFNINPDDKAAGCTTIGQTTTNCSTPGRLFDGVKPKTANNASLFHLWQFRRNNFVQLMFMFQEPVIIEKVVWTFYYNTEAQHEALHIPAANVTQWSLTAINMTDLIITTRAVHNLLVYTMVVQGSTAEQRWGSTFTAPAGQWLLLSEVEIFGTNAVEPSSSMASPSSTTTSTVVASTQLQVDTTCPVVIDSLQPEPCSAASVAPSTVPPADPSPNPATDSSTDATVIVIVVSVAVVVLLVMVTAIVAIVIAVVVCCSKQSKYSPRPSGSLPNPVHEEYEYMDNESWGVAMTSMTKNPSYATTKEVQASFTFNGEEDEADHTYEVLPFEADDPDNPTHSSQETAADNPACE